jgi:putative tryptophan/tyrosine transport system substrate-binding protein
VRRRQFIALLGGVTAGSPLAALAQGSRVQTVGFMHSLSPEATGAVRAAFLKGLGETGYIEGSNISIEYRWGRGRFDQLPGFAAELVALRVAVIVATGSTVSALAAKAATSIIPIVFTSGDDPLKVGLVEHLNRPGGNITGVTAFATVTAAKRLGLLRELLPNAVAIALLHNPKSPVDAGEMRDLETAALSLGLRFVVVEAGTETELEPAFASIASKGAQALITSTDPFFFDVRGRMIDLAARYAIPTIYDFREYPAAGGLMSYGTNIAALYRQVGVYTGKILAGAQPGDLPVVQPTSFDLVLNLKTANALGLEVPLSLLARADEVIE